MKFMVNLVKNRMTKNVILGDCFEQLSKIENESIDLIAIDPPYEISYDNLEWDKKTLNWKHLTEEFHRILKPTGNLIVFQGWSNVSETKKIVEEKFRLKNWIIWDRIKGRGANTNMVSTREDILWFTKSDKYTYNKIYSNIKKKTGGLGVKNGQTCRALSNVWTDISPIVPWAKERVSHPTQKPIQLMERIITIFSNENDLVLDCFAGSGSTGVAAKNLNRNFIMVEKEEEYHKIILKRLNPEEE
jgi:site-specific DNA-methyltransferase (adenine-specific)